MASSSSRQRPGASEHVARGYYAREDGSTPVLTWVRSLPEPNAVAWLAFVEFALSPT
ncbi:MAG: hypothetical protein NVSMB4_05790 [Acidimicrobiales bacterium]